MRGWLADQRIATIDVELEKTRLRAPFGDTVVARLADEGRVTNIGGPIFRLQEDTPPEIRVGVAGRSLERLKVGETYVFEWRDRELRARLRTLQPVRAATTRTVDALFDPFTEDARPLPGDIVSLPITTVIAEPGGWLLISALDDADKGYRLYAVAAVKRWRFPATVGGGDRG